MFQNSSNIEAYRFLFRFSATKKAEPIERMYVKLAMSSEFFSRYNMHLKLTRFVFFEKVVLLVRPEKRNLHQIKKTETLKVVVVRIPLNFNLPKSFFFACWNHWGIQMALCGVVESTQNAYSRARQFHEFFRNFLMTSSFTHSFSMFFSTGSRICLCSLHTPTTAVCARFNLFDF